MSTDALGYKQELDRRLTFSDLVIYGIVFMIPIAPFAIYGYVSNASGAMVPLAYIVGMIAMFFTALSYKVLSADFPVAGSAYAYAQRGIGEAAGFIAGWMLILDYLLLPALTYVVSAIALSHLFPAIPRWLWIVAFLTIGTITNYLGVQATAAANKLFMYAQLLVVIAFVSIGVYALYHGVGAGHLTLKPFFRPETFKIEMIFSAVSVCALSFLGFDAISTLAEEVKGNRKNTVGNATIASLLLIGALFVLQTWIAGDLANGVVFKTPDTAFYDIAELAGGRSLALVTAWATAITFGLSCSIVSQAAVCRLLYSMARDRKMPAMFSRVHSKYKTPHVALITVAVICLAVSLGFINHLDYLTSFVNFGALTGFMIVHASVVVHYMFRKRSRAIFKHLISPVIGFSIIGYVLYSMGSMTWELGISWLAAGIAYYLVLTCVLRRSGPAPGSGNI